MKQFIAIALLLVSADIAVAAAKPNIIVIYTDDHGYSDLGCQGIYQDLKTPHIDALARGGVRMSSGYVTAPQCVPSRAGLLTGRYQNRFGLESNKEHQAKGGLDGFNNSLTIAERLKTSGYVTGMAGKWHLGPGQQIPNHGFDKVFYKNSARPATANIDLKGNDVPLGRQAGDRYHLDACSDVACAFIARFQKRPFFFYLAYRAPHVPLDPPKKYLDRFPGKMPERRRKALAMISAMDDGVGRILATLRKHELEENTLIFFISDNGAPLKIHKYDAPGGGPGWDGSLNDPLNGEKGMLSEGGIRVPFVVSWKGRLPAGKVYEHPVISLDVAATAVALAGQKHDPQLDGANLIPFLTGKKRGAPHDALYWRWLGQAAVREGKWKLLQGGERRYLYNLDDDPGEKRNLLKQHPEIAQRLHTRLKRWANELKPAGLNRSLSTAANAYFDFYLEGKPAPPLRKNSRKTAGKQRDRAALFKRRDTNGDGKLTLKELIGNPQGRNVKALTRQFQSRDKDRDGKLTLEEFAGPSKRRKKP